MHLLEILFIAVGLAMDAFAVSLSAAAAGNASSPRSVFRLSFHFGLFQFLMPVLGWFAGSRVVHLISGFDHWIAFGLLAAVGGRMIQSGLRGEDAPRRSDPSRGWTLVLLSIAVSIDALAVGLSLAVLQVEILYPSLVIGVITSSLSLAGIALGQRIGKRFGGRMEVLGGLILVAIGVRVLLEHLVAGI